MIDMRKSTYPWFKLNQFTIIIDIINNYSGVF